MLYFYCIVDRDSKDMAKNLQNSLEKFGILINVLPIYNPSIGNLSKIIEFQNFLNSQTFSDDDFIILLDAFDVLCCKNPTFIPAYFIDHNIDILFSGENTCGDVFKETKDYYDNFSIKNKGESSYLNSGVIIARANKYKLFLDRLIDYLPIVKNKFTFEHTKYLSKSDQSPIRFFVKEYDYLNPNSDIKVSIDVRSDIVFTDTTVEKEYNCFDYVFVHTWGILSLVTHYRFSQLSKYHLNLEKLQILPSLKTKIVIILFEDSYYRFEHITKQINKISNIFPGLRWSIFYSVRGDKIIKKPLCDTIYSLEVNNETFFYNNSKRGPRLELTYNELACSLSHYKVYEKLIQDSNYSNYLVLEDDFVIDDINSLIKTLYRLENYNDFDIALLGYSLFYPLTRVETINDSFSTLKKQGFNNSGSYIVTKEGAKNLLGNIQKTICFPSDDTLSYYFINDKIKTIVSHQTIFTYNKSFPSTLDPCR